MRKQVVHEARDKLSDIRTCSSEDARKGKSSLQAINALTLSCWTRIDEIETYSVTHNLEFLHCPKRH